MPTQLAITDVKSGSQAEMIGLVAQDIICSIGGIAVESPDSLSQALKDCTIPCELIVLRDYKARTFDLLERTLGIEFRTRELTETALREEQLIVQTWSKENEYRQQLGRKIPIATTSFIPGHEISEVIGIVTGEAAFAIESSLVDLVFTTNGFADLKLNQAIQRALEQLRINACAIQADAVIGVSIDTSGANKNIKTGVFIAIAVGTAVKLTGTTITPNQTQTN